MVSNGMASMVFKSTFLLDWTLQLEREIYFFNIKLDTDAAFKSAQMLIKI